MKISSIRTLVVAGAAAAMLGSAAQATVVYGFEDDTVAGNSDATLVPQSTTGVTEGTYSLEIQVNTGWHKALELWNQNYAPTVLANGKMLIDVTVPQAGNWIGIDMGFYGDGQGGWQTMAATAGSVYPGATKVTLEYDYSTSSLVMPQPGATWWNILMIVNSDLPADTPIYIDNFRFEPVPEPASLGLLAIGAVAMLGRRRR